MSSASESDSNPGPGLFDQQWLVNLKNPFSDRFGPQFFKRIPDSPGVYWMIDSKRQLLYVGKSKNLRLRLMSYKYLKLERCSRKIKRLMQHVHDIQWTQCNSETSALLLENELLRRYKPPFNVINTRPETYFYVGFLWTPQLVDFGLSSNLEDLINVNAHGAFRHRLLSHQAYTALLRLTWQSLNKNPQFHYPQPLTRPLAPTSYRLLVPPWARKTTALADRMEAFLDGRSIELLEVYEDLLQFAREQQVPGFTIHWLEQDKALLEKFFHQGPARNHYFRQKFGLPDPVIPQSLLDDLIVLAKTL